MEDKFGWIILFCVIVFALVFLFSPRLADLISKVNIKVGSINTSTTTTTIITYDTLTEQYCPRELRKFLGQEREVKLNEDKSEARVDTENVIYYCKASYLEKSDEIKIEVEREQTACSGEVCPDIGVRTLVIDYNISSD
jgi:hypothetical protein